MIHGAVFSLEVPTEGGDENVWQPLAVASSSSTFNVISVIPPYQRGAYELLSELSGTSNSSTVVHNVHLRGGRELFLAAVGANGDASQARGGEWAVAVDVPQEWGSRDSGESILHIVRTHIMSPKPIFVPIDSAVFNTPMNPQLTLLQAEAATRQDVQESLASILRGVVRALTGSQPAFAEVPFLLGGSQSAGRPRQFRGSSGATAGATRELSVLFGNCTRNSATGTSAALMAVASGTKRYVGVASCCWSRSKGLLFSDAPPKLAKHLGALVALVYVIGECKIDGGRARAASSDGFFCYKLPSEVVDLSFRSGLTVDATSVDRCALLHGSGEWIAALALEVSAVPFIGAPLDVVRCNMMAALRVVEINFGGATHPRPFPVTLNPVTQRMKRGVWDRPLATLGASLVAFVVMEGGGVTVREYAHGNPLLLSVFKEEFVGVVGKWSAAMALCLGPNSSAVFGSIEFPFLTVVCDKTKALLTAGSVGQQQQQLRGAHQHVDAARASSKRGGGSGGASVTIVGCHPQRQQATATSSTTTTFAALVAYSRGEGKEKKNKKRRMPHTMLRQLIKELKSKSW